MNSLTAVFDAIDETLDAINTDINAISLSR